VLIQPLAAIPNKPFFFRMVCATVFLTTKPVRCRHQVARLKKLDVEKIKDDNICSELEGELDKALASDNTDQWQTFKPAVYHTAAIVLGFRRR